MNICLNLLFEHRKKHWHYIHPNLIAPAAVSSHGHRIQRVKALIDSTIDEGIKTENVRNC